MEKYYTPIILFIVFTAIVIGYDYIERKKREREIYLHIKENFGKVHSEKIKGPIDGIYNRLGGNLTDITYNDLNLDEIIKEMNHCASQMGIEYFYYRIRNLILNSNILQEMQNKRNMYENKEKDIINIQFSLSNVGYFKENVLGLIEEDVEIEKGLEITTKIFSFTLLYIIVAIIFLKNKAAIVSLLLIATNVYIYKEFNKKTLGKLNALIKIKNIIFVADKLTKSNDVIFGEELSELRSILKEIKPLKSTLRSFGYFTGNPQLDFAETYKNILFLSEARKYSNSQKYFKIYKEDIKKLYYLLGKIDAEIAIISISKAYDTKDAIFSDNIRGIDLYNPLLKSAVPNDLNLNKSILLTGSNASGKSTYLRTCGINAVFALSFGIFFGESLEIEPVIITSAIDISDSITKNLSYFMAESKAIGEMIKNDEKKLILLDEIFRGTNTIDRISAATATLEFLSKNNYVIAATHDIELTVLLEDDFKNMHFEEHIIDGDINFDYILKEGPARTRNAIAILENLRYPNTITKKARDIAITMEEKWKFTLLGMVKLSGIS